MKDQDALIARVQNEEDLENVPYGLMLWVTAPGAGRTAAARDFSGLEPRTAVSRTPTRRRASTWTAP